MRQFQANLGIGTLEANMNESRGAVACSSLSRGARHVGRKNRCGLSEICCGCSKIAGRAATADGLRRADVSSNRDHALSYSWRMIFSENRCTLFGIMRWSPPGKLQALESGPWRLTLPQGPPFLAPTHRRASYGRRAPPRVEQTASLRVILC